ncbi:MAG: hypothetical protein A2167_00635 [Planctomycetes bacterium RBG_13_46_10]|nr:MAG: hypothetical protein A2167_00635 [Planctomycetes bacterium RBG_13_46_10]
MADILSICTCSAVHRELYRFYSTVANRRDGWEKKAGGTLRAFAFRGQSPHIQRVMKKLTFPLIEDMSCPKFLYRAFRHIDTIKDYASVIDGYWGAYLLVLIDLWVASQKANLELPDNIPKVQEVVLFKDPKDIDTLCAIIDGLKQVVSISAKNYDAWERARTKFGANIIPRIITGFENTVSAQANWHENTQLWSTARHLVHLWYNLERTYVGELQELARVKKEEKNAHDDRVNKIRSAIQVDVCGVADHVGAILKKIADVKPISDDYNAMRNMYDTAVFELDANKKLLDVVNGKPKVRF